MIRVFLDANELSRPTTRTLLLAGAALSGVLPLWSPHVEGEADEAVKRRNRTEQKTMMLPSTVRKRYLPEFSLSAPGTTPERFVRTRGADKQVLADVKAAAAQFLVTEDVDDFDTWDLHTAEASATTADLFMSLRWTEHAYRHGIELLAKTTRNKPERVHYALGRLHPRLTAEFRNLYPYVVPASPAHRAPAVEYQGRHCIRCARVLPSSALLSDGLGPECRDLT